MAPAVTVGDRDAPAVTTLGSWEGGGVTVAQVTDALSELRRHEPRAAVRTSVLTLVAVVHDPGAATTTIDIVRELGTRHPSRTLVLVVDDAGADETAVNASVSVHALENATNPVCFEEIVLRVRGPLCWHLDSLVEPFTLPDLPVAVWLPDRLPALGDPLLDTADRIVVDTRVVGDQPDAFARVARLLRRLPVTDLSWVRLQPWRSLLAGLFEGRASRPFLDHVSDVEVAGHFGPRHLLAGWLMATLGLTRAHVHIQEAKHVSIRISAVHDGRLGRFAVVRPGDARIIHASVEIEAGPSIDQTLRMRDRWPSRSLAEALTRMGHEPVYERALRGALALLDP
jgi:glucose-6-phosphate dehydrogenase assembly protein OpcA